LEDEKEMNLAHSVFLESEIGAIEELSRSGTALENPFVFDSVANDLKRMAAAGLVEVVDERRSGAGADTLIDSFRYRRLRAG
jgi:hypothetical protein